MPETTELMPELNRIFVSSLLGCILLLLSVLIDGPVSVLGWVLFVVGFLCLTYVAVAVRQLMKHFRSQQHNA